MGIVLAWPAGRGPRGLGDFLGCMCTNLVHAVDWAGYSAGRDFLRNRKPMPIRTADRRIAAGLAATRILFLLLAPFMF